MIGGCSFYLALASPDDRERVASLSDPNDRAARKPWIATSHVQSYSLVIGSTRLDPGNWDKYTGAVVLELSASPAHSAGCGSLPLQRKF
jgi:hypothetical protein